MLRLLAAMFILQLAPAPADAPTPEPQYFHYERALTVPRGASGQACAVLDGAVFAHAAKQSLDDLRLYEPARVEKPYIITESGSTRFDEEPAEVRNLGVRSGNIVFDLSMPNRAYTAVLLDIDAKNFIATANVTGSNERETPVELGSYALFDLSSKHLSRWTTLPLQESNFRNLHIALHVAPSPSSVKRTFSAAIVKGASVPPSREAQTLYTTVATAANFTRKGNESIATVHVPAHVPIERFTFDINTSFSKDFFRDVSISARPDTAQDTESLEVIPGRISRTTLGDFGGGFAADTSFSQLSIDAALGADLRSGAIVDVAVHNGDEATLPIRAVRLQMRERRICFDASPSAGTYMLRYGDPALKPPVYDYARLFTSARSPAVAQLGPEDTNAQFKVRNVLRPYRERHPETVWLALVAAVAALGTLAMRSARRHH